VTSSPQKLGERADGERLLQLAYDEATRLGFRHDAEQAIAVATKFDGALQ
jgi:hypothetical protein